MAPTDPRFVPALDVDLPALMAGLKARRAAQRRLRFRQLLHPLRTAYPLLHPRRCRDGRAAEMRHLLDPSFEALAPHTTRRPEVAAS